MKINSKNKNKHNTALNCQNIFVYSECYPNRQVPNHQTFSNIEKHFHGRGSFAIPTVDRGRQAGAARTEIEEQILDAIVENPKSSVR